MLRSHSVSVPTARKGAHVAWRWQCGSWADWVEQLTKVEVDTTPTGNGLV